MSKVGVSLVTFITLFTNIIFAQIVAEPDCPDAYPICDASQSYYFEVSGPGAIDDAYGALGIFCQSTMSPSQWEGNSAWFTFTPKHSGEMGLYILPEIEEDWEVVVFGPNPDCSDLINNTYWLACNTSSNTGSPQGYTGFGNHPILGGGPSGSATSFGPSFNVIAGEKYVLYIGTVWVSPIIVGTRATLTFQGNLIDVHGSDAFEQTTACTLSIEEFDLSNTVSVFPNPVKDQLRISSKTNFTQLELYSITGQKVMSKAFTNTLNTSSLAKGVYFLKLYTKDGGLAFKKLVKQ